MKYIEQVWVCVDCRVEATGNHVHKKECPQAWPYVRPSQWTDEQRRRAQVGR